MRQMTKAGGLGLVLTFLCVGAWGANLGTYLFNNATDVPSVPNAVYTSFAVNPPVQSATLAGAFASSGWSTASAQDITRFAYFTLTPDPGYFLNMTSVSFDTWHRGPPPQGPTSGLAEIFLGTGPGMTSMGTVPFNISSTQTAVTFNFSEFSGADNQGITVRFYAWNAKQLNDDLYFDNVTVFGDVNPVPEPVNVALAAFGLVILGAAVQRRLCAKSVHHRSPSCSHPLS